MLLPVQSQTPQAQPLLPALRPCLTHPLQCARRSALHAYPAGPMRSDGVPCNAFHSIPASTVHSPPFAALPCRSCLPCLSRPRLANPPLPFHACTLHALPHLPLQCDPGLSSPCLSVPATPNLWSPRAPVLSTPAEPCPSSALRCLTLHSLSGRSPPNLSKPWQSVPILPIPSFALRSAPTRSLPDPA